MQCNVMYGWMHACMFPQHIFPANLLGVLFVTLWDSPKSRRSAASRAQVNSMRVKWMAELSLEPQSKARVGRWDGGNIPQRQVELEATAMPGQQ